MNDFPSPRPALPQPLTNIGKTTMNPNFKIQKHMWRMRLRLYCTQSFSIISASQTTGPLSMAPILERSLLRLSRDSLVNLCLEWAQSENSKPYLTSNRNLLESDEEDYRHEPADNVASLQQLYRDLRSKGGDKNPLLKRDIVDRIVDGDWRRGLSLQQLADIDFAHLEQNDTAVRWSALKLVPLRAQNEESHSLHPAKKRKITPPAAVDQAQYPSISPATFVAALKSHISPLVKAHYTLHRLLRHNPRPDDKPGLAVLRLCIVPNTPFAPLSSNIPGDVRQATDAGRVIYIAIPDSCPFLYISLSGSTGSRLASNSKERNAATSKTKIDIAATKRIILEAIPKAFSKPQERWSLENTKLTCRSLKAIALIRGNGRPGTSGGCFSEFSEEKDWHSTAIPIVVKGSSQSGANESVRNIDGDGALTESAPFEVMPPAVPTNRSSTEEENHKSQVDLRFGDMTIASHAKLDRFHVSINDILTPPATTTSKIPTRLQVVKTPGGGGEGPPQTRKRKRRSLEEIENGRDGDVSSSSRVQAKPEPAPITLTFSGNDVFHGLKELASINGGKYVDLSRFPSWLTGEKGVSSVVV